MKILHLYANWKWTGPAEPAVQTCVALQQRGVDVVFAAGVGPAGVEDTVAQRAAALGLAAPDCDASARPRLPKHAHPLATAADVLRVRRLLVEQGPFDLVHCHLPNDHLIGGLAARLAGIPVARTFYDGQAGGRLRERFLATWCTDLALAPSQATARRLERYRSLRGRVQAIETPVDLERFDPDKPAARSRTDQRAAWGLGGDMSRPVFGLVARIQARRRFDLLVEAAALLAQRPAWRETGAALAVIGRGTHQEEVLEAPVRARGLEATLRAVGYARAADYHAALAALDGLIYLVPGTDGSCRTVREAMAMGLPVVATRRGILPELVEDGATGLLIDETPEGLAAALERLATDPALRAAMGAAGRADAHARFDAAAVGCRLIEAYGTLAGGR